MPKVSTTVKGKNVILCLLNESANQNRVEGFVIGQHDFAIDFCYDENLNVGMFTVVPIIYANDSMHLIYCDVSAIHEIHSCPDLESFVSALIEVSNKAKIRFSEDEAFDIYWDALEGGLRVYPKDDDGIVRLEALSSLYGDNTDITLVDTKNMRVEMIGDHLIAEAPVRIIHQDINEEELSSVKISVIDEEIRRIIEEARSN